VATRGRTRVRAPAVAGTFYPADPEALAAAVDGYLEVARRERGGPADAPPPKALIAPHAGYVYSGPVAAAAYVAVEPLRGVVQRVVLLGPSHRVPLRGLAVGTAQAFATPLGDVPVDAEAVEDVLRLPQVKRLDAPHEWEHSLEVQLPFLQRVLGAFRLVPLSVGDATPEQVAEVLELLWGGRETLVVVSSDLSHYHDYETARRLDARTTRAIEALEPGGLDEESACGRVPARGLLVAAKRHRLRVRTLDLRNSGDTAGSRAEVVGYGSYAFA
jgi:AmmeMemoRadiSam system protein B